MQHTTRRMVAILGIGTILVVALLLLAFHFVIGSIGLNSCLSESSIRTTLPFIKDELDKSNQNVDLTNQNIPEGKSMVYDLSTSGLQETKPLESPLKFTYFKPWHREVRMDLYVIVMSGTENVNLVCVNWVYINWYGINKQQEALVELQSKSE